MTDAAAALPRLLAAPPRALPALLLAAPLAALAAALLFQYVGGLPPCQLCHWQRWAHIAAAVLVLPAVVRPAGVVRHASLAAAALAFLAGTGIALFHVGVEQHWWAGLASCTGAAGATTLEELRAQIMAAPVVRCDDVRWALLGLSMAAWNGLLSLALFLLAAAGAVARRREVP
jgi:disulfide bond formation protein DsbB